MSRGAEEEDSIGDLGKKTVPRRKGFSSQGERHTHKGTRTCHACARLILAPLLDWQAPSLSDVLSSSTSGIRGVDLVLSQPQNTHTLALQHAAEAPAASLCRGQGGMPRSVLCLVQPPPARDGAGRARRRREGAPVGRRCEALLRVSHRHFRAAAHLPPDQPLRALQPSM